MSVEQRHKLKDSRHLRLCLALLASLILHGLGLLLLTIVFPRQARETMLTVRLVERPRFEPKRFVVGKAWKWSPLRIEMEKEKGPPEEVPSPYELPSPLPSVPEPTDQALLDVPLGIGRGEKEPSVRVPSDTTSLEESAWRAFKEYLEQRERYRWLPLVDADTTDAESASQRRALRVVFEAIEAMGGKEALLTIRDMSCSGHYYKAYGPRSKYATYLPGGARIIYDGDRAWIEIYRGRAYPIQGKALREIKHRSERWGFLSRFLGEGIRLAYSGSRFFRDRVHHVIKVEDLKYGEIRWALFDRKTHLLTAVEEPLGSDTYLQDTYLDYRSCGSALTSHTMERQKLEKDRLGRSYPIGVPRSHSITYNALSDELFELSKRNPGWEGLDNFEVQGALWVKVILTSSNSSIIRGVLPGATSRLTGTQKGLIEQQVAETVVHDIRQRGLFRRVLVLSERDL